MRTQTLDGPLEPPYKAQTCLCFICHENGSSCFESDPSSECSSPFESIPSECLIEKIHFVMRDTSLQPCGARLTASYIQFRANGAHLKHPEEYKESVKQDDGQTRTLAQASSSQGLTPWQGNSISSSSVKPKPLPFILSSINASHSPS